VVAIAAAEGLISGAAESPGLTVPSAGADQAFRGHLQRFRQAGPSAIIEQTRGDGDLIVDERAGEMVAIREFAAVVDGAVAIGGLAHHQAEQAGGRSLQLLASVGYAEALPQQRVIRRGVEVAAEEQIDVGALLIPVAEAFGDDGGVSPTAPSGIVPLVGQLRGPVGVDQDQVAAVVTDEDFQDSLAASQEPRLPQG